MVDELKTDMSLNFFDIVFQTWSLKCRNIKMSIFAKGLFPNTCTHHSYQYRFLQYVWQCCGKL